MREGERVVYPVWHEYTASVKGWEAVEFPRLLGIYAARRDAEQALADAAELPGFDGVLGEVDDDAGLLVDEVTLNHRAWDTGFVTLTASDDEGGS